MVPSRLIPVEGGITVDRVGQGAIDGSGAELGVAESIADPVRRDRVFRVAGVTDQRPTWPPCLAEVTTQSIGAAETADPSSPGYQVGEVGSPLTKQAIELCLGICGEALAKSRRPPGEDQTLRAVGRNQPGIDPGAELEPIALASDAVEVGVVNGVGRLV
jgi:hypothetical protein